MKIIFLNIDGVLNNDNHTYHYGNNYIDDNLLNLFAAIVKSTSSEVVLSSTWKNSTNKVDSLLSKLSKYNIKILEIISPLDQSWINPSEEIKKWLQNHPQVIKWAIIDNSLELFDSFKESLFVTDPELGLTEDLALDIIEHMNYAYQPIN